MTSREKRAADSDRATRVVANPLRAVVVGTGWGAQVHVPSLRQAGFDVVALVGRNADKTARIAKDLGVPQTCASLEEALRAKPDVVTIATHPDTHARFTLEAIAAGCHVVCEKPFTLDAAEANEVARAAANAGVVGLVGNEFRWAPDRDAVLQAIAAGRIGEPRLGVFAGRMNMAADPSVAVPAWWFEPKVGGGWLANAGSHTIDMIRSWLGDFDAVSAGLPVTSAREVPAEDSFDVRFRLRCGLDGSLVHTQSAWGPRHDTTWVAGTLGTVWLDGHGAWIADATSPEGVQLAPRLIHEAASDASPNRVVGLTAALYGALRAAIDGRESEVPLPTFQDAVLTMAVMDAIRGSAAASGAWSAVNELSTVAAVSRGGTDEGDVANAQRHGPNS